MKKLNLKPTGEAAAILFGFFAVLTAASCAMQAGTADAVRVVIYEWGAFPLLCAIVGGVIARKSGIRLGSFPSGGSPHRGGSPGEKAQAPFAEAFRPPQHRPIQIVYSVFEYTGGT